MKLARVIERGDGYQILAFPFWVPESTLRAVAENVRKDAAIQGRPVKIAVGHRLIRVEEASRDHR